MRKRFIILLVALSAPLCAFAQESKILDDIKIGANLGFSVPTMRYSSNIYGEYDRNALFSGMGGLFVDWNFYDNLSVRPHLDFVGRGVKMMYDPLMIDYKLKATYFDLRIPVVYTFDLKSKVKPFVAAGPSFNFVTGGKIRYAEGSADRQVYDLKLSKGNFKPFDLGLYVGGGFGYPVKFAGIPVMVGAEVGYNIGLLNTFSSKELQGQSVAVNTPVYDVSGTRKNGNLSISLNISIPLKGLFGRKKKPKSQNIMVPVAPVERPVVERRATVMEKECCSLDEMYELILNGQDISMKKVCAFTDINFDFDKATLRPESEAYLDKFVTILHKFPTLQLSIIGHTDDVGDYQYNLVLSKKRAEAVATYFVMHGIDADRLHCYGYGSRQPLVDNTSKEARAMNRRVEFDIIEN